MRTISALENLAVRRSKKHARASSQWKLPLWVPTILAAEENFSAGEQRKLLSAVGMKGAAAEARKRHDFWIVLNALEPNMVAVSLVPEAEFESRGRGNIKIKEMR